MNERGLLARVARFFKAVYIRLFRIDDTPQKIASGLGISVFTGVLPGAGPIAALALALLFRANRASALLGSILTNTWLSIPVFVLSLRAGAAISGVDYRDLLRDWTLLLSDFHWATLCNMAAYRIIAPIIFGYILMSIAFGLIAYVLALTAVGYGRRNGRRRSGR